MTFEYSNLVACVWWWCVEAPAAILFASPSLFLLFFLHSFFLPFCQLAYTITHTTYTNLLKYSSSYPSLPLILSLLRLLSPPREEVGSRDQFINIFSTPPRVVPSSLPPFPNRVNFKVNTKADFSVSPFFPAAKISLESIIKLKRKS